MITHFSFQNGVAKIQFYADNRGKQTDKIIPTGKMKKYQKK